MSEVIHLFRYDAKGRIAEERVESDARVLLQKLGATP